MIESLLELLQDVSQYLAGLGPTYWILAIIVAAVWFWSWFRRWRIHQGNRRRQREFEKAAEQRWSGNRQGTDPWTDRIGYRSGARGWWERFWRKVR
jgi:hypothetical protein